MAEIFESDYLENELTQKYQIIQHKAHEYRLSRVWEKFESAGFKLLLIKGWVSARKYPNPYQRSFVDFDLVFSPEDFDCAVQFQRENSFEYSIDLHRGVRHLDTLSFAELYDRSETIELENCQIKVPCEEDHLRIICVHWLNDGGQEKEKLWDIYHAVNNRRHDFDWDKCLSVVNEKRRRWIICAIGLTHRYFDLDLSSTPIENEARKLPKWLIKTVEKDWKEDVRLLPLSNFRFNSKEYWQQVRKRLPPNAIQATIETNGDFDRYPRIYYQILDIFKRIYVSAKRRSATK